MRNFVLFGLYLTLSWMTPPSAFGGHEAPALCYSSRPSILSVQALAHPDLSDKTWELLKRAQLEYVAQILGLYPYQEIYFLARDAELLYDLSVLLLQTADPAQINRLHIVNVSRAHLKREATFEYLKQKGLSAETIFGGKNFILIDTGFSGSIPYKIRAQLISGTEIGREPQLRAHFIASSSPDIPSSRVFLSTINAATVDQDPAFIRNTVLQYEYLPRYTYRSTDFQLMDQRWEPITPKEDQMETDGKVSQTEAVLYMKDLKAFARQEATQVLFRDRLALWTQLKQMTEALSQAELIAYLKSTLTRTDIPAEAIVRDLVDWITKTPGTNLRETHLLADLDLPPPHVAIEGTNTWQLIQKNPHWRTYLTNPKIEIPKLVQRGDFHILNPILDVIVDAEIQRIIFRSLGGPFLSEAIMAQAIRALVARIELGQTSELEWIAAETFSRPCSIALTDVLDALIKQAHPAAIRILILNGFFHPHSVHWRSHFAQLTETEDSEVLTDLIRVFTKPHSVHFKEFLPRLLHNVDDKVLEFVGKRILTRGHVIEFGPEAFLIYEKRLNKTN